eukprot:4957342-Prymnesium_polylepis.2
MRTIQAMQISARAVTRFAPTERQSQIVHVAPVCDPDDEELQRERARIDEVASFRIRTEESGDEQLHRVLHSLETAHILKIPCNVRIGVRCARLGKHAVTARCKQVESQAAGRGMRSARFAPRPPSCDVSGSIGRSRAYPCRAASKAAAPR